MLEIGPGVGALTHSLSRAAQVTAVELDERMAAVLSEVAPEAKIVQGDVLKVDLLPLIRELPEPRCIVSNMPYNITGPLLAKVSDCRAIIEKAVLMMQKEVGDRVIAPAGAPERGALSVSMQLQFSVRKVCDAPAGAFMPPPKVDSIVLEFVPRFDVDRTERVLEVVRAGFTQPRKTLTNNLSSAASRERLHQVMGDLRLDSRVRPHQLTNDQWVALAKEL